MASTVARNWEHIGFNSKTGTVITLARKSVIICRSTDYGVTWEDIQLPPNLKNIIWYSGIACNPNTGVWVITNYNGGEILVSRDDGLTWKFEQICWINFKEWASNTWNTTYLNRTYGQGSDVSQPGTISHADLAYSISNVEYCDNAAGSGIKWVFTIGEKNYCSHTNPAGNHRYQPGYLVCFKTDNFDDANYRGYSLDTNYNHGSNKNSNGEITKLPVYGTNGSSAQTKNNFCGWFRDWNPSFYHYVGDAISLRYSPYHKKILATFHVLVGADDSGVQPGNSGNYFRSNFYDAYCTGPTYKYREFNCSRTIYIPVPMIWDLNKSAPDYVIPTALPQSNNNSSISNIANDDMPWHKCIAYDKTSGIMYSIRNNINVVHSLDGGDSWLPSTVSGREGYMATPPRVHASKQVRSVAADDGVVIATLEDTVDEVYRSVDRGYTWTKIQLTEAGLWTVHHCGNRFVAVGYGSNRTARSLILDEL